MKVKKNNKLVSIVDGEKLNFVAFDSSGAKKTIQSVNIEDLINSGGDTNFISHKMRDWNHSLMIVPDYWFGNSVYKFQSGRKSLADAFVERKLKAQFEQQDDIKHFFDCILFQREREEQWLYAFFLQDPNFFRLYQALCELNLAPRRITSPAYLWVPRFREEVSEFDTGGKCFIQQLPDIYHLYFFFEGNFLFSRSIPLTDIHGDVSDKLQTITYELNQSLYLFSQRARSEVDKLYLLACESEGIQELSDALGREIIELKSTTEDPQRWHSPEEPLDPQTHLPAIHLRSQPDYLFLSHRKLQKELEWKSVQTVGMFIGLLLILLMGLESIFLHKFSYQHSDTFIHATGIVAGDVSEQIRLYNQALDVLIAEVDRPSPQDVLAKVAKSLPYDVRLLDIVLETESDPSIYIKGVVKGVEPEHLKGSLTALIVALNKNLKLRRALAMPDIDLEPDMNKQNYFFKFKAEL
jgi:hypothetical protein